MGWYERNIGYSRESRNYYRRSVLEEIKSERRQRKKQIKFAAVFVGNIACILLTLILWMMSGNTKNTELSQQKFKMAEGQTFEVVHPGKIHQITLKIPYSTAIKNFERATGVLMDLYGPDGRRVYSFYKTLWWYRESSEDKGASEPLVAKIILNEKGTYKIRAYTMDDEFTKKIGPVDMDKERLMIAEATVKSKSSGSLYFSYLLIFEVALLVLFLVASNYVGNPLSLWNLVKEDIGLLTKPIPLLYFGMIAAFLILIMYWNYLGIGYAGYGDYLHSPNWFFGSDDVIYIG
ncbi:MAG: hypothetical protein KDC84_12875 [Crocinitomicaceae bacterium]|nr:hypothetical protein [Crocinitomicaceae bacterium]